MSMRWTVNVVIVRPFTNVWGRGITSTANNIFKSGTAIAGTKWSIPSLRSCYMAFQWYRDVMIRQPLNMESRIQIPEMKTETETESRIKQLHQKKNKKAKFTFHYLIH